MKNKNTSDLAARFSAWHKAQKRASLGAVALVSLSASRSLADESGAANLMHATVAAHSTNDTIADDEQIGIVSRLADHDEIAPAPSGIGPYLLTPAERAQLAREYTPRAKVAPAPAPVDPLDTLPIDFTPPPVLDYVSETAGLLSPDELAAIASEATREIAEIDRINARDAAAVNFLSDYAGPLPIDYAPPTPAIVRSVATPPAPVDEMEALRLAVLSLSR
jgi:hypothetical protein